MAENRWEHFSHDADIGVRGIGRTKEDAFQEIAVALTAVVADPQTVAPAESVSLRCEASDDELLVVDWLNALIYEMATRNMLFSRFQVDLRPPKLTATAWGEKIDGSKHQPAVEVKGATYTGLRLYKSSEEELWTAECVVDV